MRVNAQWVTRKFLQTGFNIVGIAEFINCNTCLEMCKTKIPLTDCQIH